MARDESASKSLAPIRPISRAISKWYSSSDAEFNAKPIKRPNSLPLLYPVPSTIFVGIDIAARMI